jgi:hypothetical protein
MTLVESNTLEIKGQCYKEKVAIRKTYLYTQTPFSAFSVSD